MTADTASARPRTSPVLREEGRVTPLELFFDLVFVLALTQCTALMADNTTWEGLAQGVLILGVLWWAWVGYAWLTSVVDPEEGIVRITMFVSMAAMLVVALAVPEAFGEHALLLACAYAVVRVAHIVLFWLASRDDPQLRSSVSGLAVSSAVAVALLVTASFLDGPLQGAVWALALVLDMGGPFVFGAEGWKLIPQHFAERHGLILIIALGESIVAIGIGAEYGGLTTGVVVAGVLGIVVAAALWWLYFDVIALVAERRLQQSKTRRERNEVGRDCYSYLHFPMVAGIVLLALGLKKTVEHVDEPLKAVAAVALLGGTAAYLVAHVGFRWRAVHRLNVPRLALAVLLVVLVAAGVELPALVTLAILAALLVALLVYEAHHFAELRTRLRAQLVHE